MVKINKTMGLTISGRDPYTNIYKSNTFYVTIPDIKFSAGPPLIVARNQHACGVVKDSEESDKR